MLACSQAFHTLEPPSPQSTAPLRGGDGRSELPCVHRACYTASSFINLYSPVRIRFHAQAKRYGLGMPSVTLPADGDSIVASPVDVDPWQSAPVSRASSVHLRRRNRTRTNPEEMTSNAHPLAGLTSSSSKATANASEASRPTLRRLTTENEKQLAETSRSGSDGGNLRDSLDMLSMTGDAEADGIQVLVHQVCAGDSLAGVSLQYGIDLAILRKANKLWASDTIHSRKQLYIPLEACRWGKATESFSRGPEANQITLTAKSAKRQENEVDRSFSNLHLLDAETGTLPRSTSGSVYGGSEWGEEGEAAKAFMPDTNLAYEAETEPEPPLRVSKPPTVSEAASASSAGGREQSNSSAQNTNPSVRIMTIVKLPGSQLQFFPKGQQPENSKKGGHRPSVPSAHPQSGAIRNNLHTLPPPLKSSQSSLTASTTSKVVRLRPPTISSQRQPESSSNVTSRLSSLFNVAPPSTSLHVRTTSDSGYSSPKFSRQSSYTSAPLAATAEALELHPRHSAELPRSSDLRPNDYSQPVKRS